MKVTGMKLLIAGGLGAAVLAGAGFLMHSPAAWHRLGGLHGTAGIHASGPAAEVVGAMTGDPAANERARAGVARIGRQWNEAAFAGTVALYTDVHRGIGWPGVLAAETVRYGEAPAQTFELYLPEQEFSEPGPVFLLLHGNGLGSFDRIAQGSDGLIHSHLGKIGAVAGGIGISMNYRGPEALRNRAAVPSLAALAAGAEDLRLVIEWIVGNIGAYGGDPETIVLAANSEAATIAAAYLFNEEWQTAAGPGIAAAVLSSGLFGSRAPQIEELIGRFDGRPVPLALWSGEFDVPEVAGGVDALHEQLCRKYQQCPFFETFPGHNHLSYLMSMGTADTYAMNALIEFYHTVR